VLDYWQQKTKQKYESENRQTKMLTRMANKNGKQEWQTRIKTTINQNKKNKMK